MARGVGGGRRRVRLEILPPLDLTAYRAAGPHGTRRATDALMRTLAARTGQQYVDEYARRRPDHGLAA
jgi:1-acyl-sn-glycerol-3-phosphate acyltransferase